MPVYDRSGGRVGELRWLSSELQVELWRSGRLGATREQGVDRVPPRRVVGGELHVPTGQMDDSTHAESTILRGGPTCPKAPPRPTPSRVCCAAAPRRGRCGSTPSAIRWDGRSPPVLECGSSPPRRPRRGEVWAMCDDDGRVIVHRVLGSVGDRWWMQGDANRSPDRPVGVDRLIGRVDEVEVAGRRRRLGARRRLAGRARLDLAAVRKRVSAIARRVRRRAGR